MWGWSLNVAVLPESEPVRAWLSLGRNIEPRRHIAQAIEDLQALFGDLVISPVYESKAVGLKGDNFYNLVVGVVTRLSPQALVQRLRGIEEKNGRLREADKFAPRTLDVDLLTYGDRVLSEPGLQLPREEITRYAFVLLPLSEVAGDEIYPPNGLSYQALWAAFDDPHQVLWRIPWDGRK